MKKKFFQSFTLLLIVFSLFHACGKDNKNKDDNNNDHIDTSANQFGSPLINNSSNQSMISAFNQFKSRLASSSNFASTGYYTYDFVNWTRDVNDGFYGQPDCDELWGFLKYCSYSSSSSNNFTETGTFSRTYTNANSISHELGSTKSAIHSALISLANNAQHYDQGFGSSYYTTNHYGIHYIVAADDKIYGIDFNRPLHANPVYMSTNSGSAGYMIDN